MVWDITYIGFFGNESHFQVSNETEDGARNAFRLSKPQIKDADILSIKNLTVAVDVEKKQKRIAKGKTRISNLIPEQIAIEQLSYLNSIKNRVRLRFSWPPDVDEAVRELFSSLHLALPEDIRPMDSGKYGGEPMYSLSTELSFPIPDNGLDFDGSQLSSDGKNFEISRVTFSLGLVKEGFPINVYARN